MWPSWEQTLLIFAAAMLEGAVGFDFGLVATPALGAVLGVRGAVVLLTLPNLGLALWKTAGGKMSAEQLHRLMPFLGAGGLGAAAGVFILLSTPPAALKWGVGLLVLLCVAYSASRARFQLDSRDEVFFAYVLGFFAGAFSGLAYAGGPLVVIFLDSLGLSRARLVKLAHITGLVFAAVQMAALSGAGALGEGRAMVSAMALLPALAGFLVGRVMRGRFSPALGYRAGLGLLIASTIALIAFGPAGWR